jgi:hypothetical protein
MSRRLRGRLLFSTIGCATFPKEFAFRRTVYEADDGDGCLIVLERRGLLSARTVNREVCHRMLEAYRAISSPEDALGVDETEVGVILPRRIHARGVWIAVGGAVGVAGDGGSRLQHPIEQVTQNLLALLAQMAPILHLM